MWMAQKMLLTIISACIEFKSWVWCGQGSFLEGEMVSIEEISATARETKLFDGMRESSSLTLLCRTPDMKG
jgi:hypothetical protein